MIISKTYRSFALFIMAILAIVGMYLYYLYVPPLSHQVRVGATYMTLNNEFYQVLNAEIEKNLSVKGELLYVRDPELDEIKQSQQIDYFIEKKVDVIVISPVKSESSQIFSALKRAKQAGIQIIVVDSQLNEANLADTTIVSDNVQAGVLLAQDMMHRLSSANILLLEHRTTRSAIERIDGFLETIKGHPSYKVVSQRETMGQTEDSMPQVQKALEDGTNFNVIISLNDRTAIGALAAVKDKGVADKFYIYGVDGSPDMKDFIANTDDITATVSQSPIQMGEKVTEVIDLMMDHQPYQDFYKIPVGLITKETIAQYSLAGWQ